MYTYVLVHTSIFPKFWFSLILPCPLLDTRRYLAVQGRTRKSRTPRQWSARRYKAVHSLVPSCTSLYLTIQGYGTFWYCHVPHCTKFTALYHLVPPCIQERTRGYKAVWQCTRMDILACSSLYLTIPTGRNMCSTCWYVLVHTSMYWYEPVHTRIYV